MICGFGIGTADAHAEPTLLERVGRPWRCAVHIPGLCPHPCHSRVTHSRNQAITSEHLTEADLSKFNDRVSAIVRRNTVGVLDLLDLLQGALEKCAVVA